MDYFFVCRTYDISIASFGLDIFAFSAFYAFVDDNDQRQDGRD